MESINTMLFRPTREVEELPGGKLRVTVTPPAFVRCPASSLDLTAEQFERYQDWLYGGVLIQDALPELSRSDREILQTGLGPEKQGETFSEQED